MRKLPYSIKEAQQLVDNGHMTPETFAHAHSMGAFLHPHEVQMLAEGGEVDDVEGDAPAASPPVDNAGISNGDIHPIDAISNALSGGGSQEAYDQSLASLPKTPDDASMGMNPAQVPGGVTVASNDPSADRQIASQFIKPEAQSAGQTTEAGHMPTSALAIAPAPQPDPTAAALKGDVAQVMGGMGQERKGTEDYFKAGAAQAAETAGYLHTMRQHAENQQAVEQVKEDERQSAANDQYQKVQKAADEAAQAGKIDPNHFWGTRTTGQKIAAAIGLALGGIGGGLSGHGGNVALDVINKAIDRDMDAQKANASHANQAYGNQMSLYGAMRQKFGDERQAFHATQMAYLQSAEMQVREISAKYQSPEMQAKAQMVIGGLQQKQGLLAQQIHQSAYQAAAMRQLMGGESSAAGLAALPEKVQARVVPLDGGARHGIAYDEKSANEVRGVSSAADNVKQIINQMRQLKDEGGKRILPYGTLMAKSQALQSRLIPAMNEMAGLKRLSEEDIKNLHKQIPDVGSWMSDKSDALLDGLEQSVHDRTESYYKNNLEGYKPSHFTRKR